MKHLFATCGLMLKDQINMCGTYAPVFKYVGEEDEALETCSRILKWMIEDTQ